MFYEFQPLEAREYYKDTLALVGSLSRLFSTSDVPMLHYRAHENIFCDSFEAYNCSRDDKSVDAVKDRLGIGLKTWVNSSRNDQKIAEFGRLKDTYEKLDGLELVKVISKYRNERIKITKNVYGLTDLIYHIVKRIHYGMEIYEAVFDEIDIQSICLLEDRGSKNNIYFFDEKHTYHFSTSKNTLYMLFEDMQYLDYCNVQILEDPIDALQTLKDYNFKAKDYNPFAKENVICLRLYSTKKNRKYIPEKSGLNQWNALGRERHENEVYIPFPSQDRKKHPNFFPPRDTAFLLHLPDGKDISAKVCQDDGKAIMSNPNKVLGKWLLRDVFELPPRTVLTYEMLKVFNIDSVVFTKINNNEYSIDFTELGTYEKWIENI